MLNTAQETLAQPTLIGVIVILAIGLTETIKHLIGKRNGKNGEVAFHVKELRRETGEQTKLLQEMLVELRRR